MSKKLNRWLRSTTGMITIAVIIVAAVVVAVLLSGGGPGTVWPPPPPHYPPPGDGYTCLPTCDETDGKFFRISNQGMDTFAGAKIVVWIAVPGDYTQFEIGIFDGDSGKDNSGNVNIRGGNWDDSSTEATYTLYADPLKDGAGTIAVGTWRGNGDPMPNNAWYDITLNVSPEAIGPSRHYYYRLEITQDVQVIGGNGFKLRSNGYLSTGRAGLVEADIALYGNLVVLNDIPLIYPQYTGDIRNPGPSTYTGDWQLYFYVPNDQRSLELWDGDFDRGSANDTASDTDDLNTEGKPPWAGPDAVDERAGGRGSPADDTSYPLFTRSPAVKYTIVDPAGTPLYTNEEPSGTEEWERFVISTDPSVAADMQVGELKEGFYNWHIEGLDMHNLVFIRTDFQVCDPEEEDCGPPEWPEGNCPRTIGYWKNNVKKVLIDGKTKGVQETRESIEWALDQVAKASLLFRSGLNLNDPEAIGAAVRLTDQEANTILQRDAQNYPADSLTMLARALQQNLASWLNLASYNLDTEDPDDGKLGPTTWVVLNVYGGTFEGTVMAALREAESIILNASGPNDPQLERAKDIGDQLNNGLLGEDAADSTCADYEVVMPPDKQPPAYKDMPEAPVAPEPPDPTPVPEPDTATCGARVNQYNVESPTNAPFYGIKFEFASGTEVKNSDYEVFKFTLTQEQAAAMTSVQMEAKAGPDVESGTILLENCQFDQAIPCGEPVTNDNHLFAFYFMGAVDNGDGTLTLTFQVQNFSDKGLSHATIGLPEGAVPSVPTGSYQSEVCP